MLRTVWRFLVLCSAPLTFGCGTDGHFSLEGAWAAVTARLGRSVMSSPMRPPPLQPAPSAPATPVVRRQSAKERPGTVAERRAARTIPEIQRALETVRRAQAEAYAADRTYSSALDVLGVQPEPGIAIRVIWASSWGWAAVARDSVRPSVACAMYVGIVPYPGRRERRITGGRQGVPLCEGVTGSSRAVLQQLLAADRARFDLTTGAMALMRHDLTQLAASQRQNRAVYGTYARRFNRLALRYVPTPGVTLQILRADDSSWSAEATYDQLPAMSCVIWGGQPVQPPPATVALHKQPEVEGVPACDDDESVEEDVDGGLEPSTP